MDATKAGLADKIGYGKFLLFIAGMGGLLYGIDVGIIAAALLYLGKTISLSLQQTSIIVAAVLGGSMLSSLVAGFFADLLGRKTMMIVSGLMFVVSVGLIVIAQGFVPLFIGRLLQGMSGGVIAVVVPLYLAEALSADTRGRGSAVFQFALTVGIVIASLAGLFYTHQAETAIAAAHGDAALIYAAQNHAWRAMFLSVVYPGLIFFVGSFFISETPRWLFGKGRKEAALDALRRSSPEDEAQRQFAAMSTLAAEKSVEESKGAGTLMRRKYVIPFVLACLILGLNQATGINSILGYLVIILRQAGMTAQHATQGDLSVKVLNCLMTIVAVALVDKKGRKFLLMIGTGGIIVSLAAAAFFFHSFESKRVDVMPVVQAQVKGNTVDVPLKTLMAVSASGTAPTSVTVLYSYGDGEKVATALSDEGDGLLTIHPDAAASNAPLVLKKAMYGAIPSEQTGWIIALCVALFIAAYSAGPGVVVWLALSELMPTRIRSNGMGFALLINQGVSTLIAGLFLPTVGNYGYAAMFGFWAACTVLYFVIAVFFLPETKGKTLEEIELGFEGKSA
jgi:SP family myo-inositol transporter-like MFS transporter 13